MGLLDIFKTKRSSQPKEIDLGWSKLFLQYTSEYTNNNQNTTNYIEEGYEKNPTVYSIVDTVSKNAGLAKWGVYKKGKDGTMEPYNVPALQELMYCPNSMSTWNHLIQEAITWKMVTGNLYFWGIKGGNTGKTVSLYVLPSDKVDINITPNQRDIAGYSLDFFGRDPKDIIPKDEVLHIKNVNLDFETGSGDFLYGQSPLEAAYISLKTNNDAIATSGAYLKNQGPRGLIGMDQSDEQYGAVSEEQIQALRSRWKKEHTGTNKAGELLIVPGKPNWVEIGSSSADLQLIEHYNLTVNDICNVYSFPTILLGNGETAFANIDAAKKSLWTNSIVPILSEIRDGLNTWLSPQFGDNVYIDFDLSDVMELQEDKKMQADAISKLQNVITVNEARAILGMAPLDGEEGERMYMFTQGVEDGKAGSDSQSEGSEAADEKA